MKGYIKHPVMFAMLLIFAAQGQAEPTSPNHQDNKAERASARIKLRVVIPKMLLLRNADATSSQETLAFPTTITASSGNGRLLLHGNSGSASIVEENGTMAETTYTAASL